MALGCGRSGGLNCVQKNPKPWWEKKHDAICRKNLGHEFCLANAESGPLSRIWGSWFSCNLLKGFYASANIYRRLVLVAAFNPDTKSVLMQTNWPSCVRVVCPTTSFVAVKYRSFVVWPERTPQRLPPCWYSHTGDKKAIYETFADSTAVRYSNNSWSLKSVIGNLKNSLLLLFFFNVIYVRNPLFSISHLMKRAVREEMKSLFSPGTLMIWRKVNRGSTKRVWQTFDRPLSTRHADRVCAGNENRSKNRGPLKKFRRCEKRV